MAYTPSLANSMEPHLTAKLCVSELPNLSELIDESYIKLSFVYFKDSFYL